MRALFAAIAFLMFAGSAGAQTPLGPSAPFPNVITTAPITVGHTIINDGGISYVDGGAPGGTGDVNGPASSVINNFANFSDITGKNIKDSGISTGTSGAAIPVLNGVNTWSSLQTFSGGISATTVNGYASSGLNLGAGGQLFIGGSGVEAAGASVPSSVAETVLIGPWTGGCITGGTGHDLAAGFNALGQANSTGCGTLTNSAVRTVAVGTDAIRNASGAFGDTVAVGNGAFAGSGNFGITVSNGVALGSQACNGGTFGATITLTQIICVGQGTGGNIHSGASGILIGLTTAVNYSGTSNIIIDLGGDNFTSGIQDVIVGGCSTLATGSGDFCGGIGSNVTTAGTNNAVALGGNGSGGQAGALAGPTGISIGAGVANTSNTGTGNVLIAPFGFRATLNTGNSAIVGLCPFVSGVNSCDVGSGSDTNAIVIGAEQGLTTLGSHTFNIDGIIKATGTGTPSTSVTTVAGSLVVSGAGSAQITALTASLPVYTDASKNLTSTAPAGYSAVLSGTTGSIGGGVLLAGACTSGTVAVTNSTTAMSVLATPVTYPGDGVTWAGYVSTAGTVTVKVCAIVGLTPGATAYNVRIIQ